MNITIDEVRNILRKDNFEYINKQIERFADEARAALFVAIGYKNDLNRSAGAVKIRAGCEGEFDKLSDSFIVEYCRNRLDLVENEKTLVILANGCEALLEDAGDE